MRMHVYKGQQVIGFCEFKESEEAIHLQWTQIVGPERRRGFWRIVVQTLLDHAREAGKPVFIDFVDRLTERSPSTYVTQEWQASFYRGFGFVDLFRYGSELERTRLVWPDADWTTGEPPGAREHLIEDLA